MTNREQEVLSLLRKNPMISQNELAQALGITRSSAAVHITNLMKKGRILGKGYLLRESRYVCVLGGSNVDILGSPRAALIPRDSNIGTVKLSLGGVGRNIAENLVRMGVETRLISAVGEDAYGRRILEEARVLGLDMGESLVLPDAATSVHLCILDDAGDMVLAINSMDIYERMTVEFLQSKRPVLENAALCVLDTNPPAPVLEYVLTACRDTVFFLDAVSTVKARKVKPHIGRFHTVKPNRLEAEALCGIEIRTEEDRKRAAGWFHEQGVHQVFLTLGEQGVFYSTPEESGLIPAPRVTIVNATGAGDAFTAALALGYAEGLAAGESARLACAAAAIAMAHENTINPAMSRENLYAKAKELGLL